MSTSLVTCGSRCVAHAALTICNNSGVPSSSRRQLSAQSPKASCAKPLGGRSIRALETRHRADNCSSHHSTVWTAKQRPARQSVVVRALE
eukprot:1183272-Prorocentrum_minimum.AAC.1